MVTAESGSVRTIWLDVSRAASLVAVTVWSGFALTNISHFAPFG